MAFGISEKARANPAQVALVDGRVQLTWAEVNDFVNRWVHALQAHRASSPDKTARVAVFAANSVEAVLAHLAILHAGAAVVPVNFHLTAHECEYILREANVDLIFVGPENAKRALEAAHTAGDVGVICWRPDHGGVTSLDSWLEGFDVSEPSTTTQPVPYMMFTSGTSGIPKAVELSRNQFGVGDTVAELITSLRLNNQFTAYGTHLVVGPLHHVGPLNGVRVLGAGIPVIVLNTFDAEGLLKAVNTFSVTSTLLVPTHFTRLLSLRPEVRAAYDVSSLRYVHQTGAGCSRQVKEEMIAWWGPVFVESYGGTEVGTVCRISSQEWLARPGSVGRVVPPFVRAFAVDDNNQQLSPGEEGRLFIEDGSGRGVVYLRDPEKTRAAHLRPGVFTLGEVGRVDENGFVYITDRTSDMIVSGGVNIYPAEAENALITHPAVADVSVIGVPHDDMGEAAVGLIVLEPDAEVPSPELLLAYCRERLAGYKCPRIFEIVESLPRNAMGKVAKARLRKEYLAQGSLDH
jgi:long-chain acyl-CoA synthetase